MTRGELLKSLRSARPGMTQQRLADEAGVDRTTLSSFERDQRAGRGMHPTNALAVIRALHAARTLSPTEVEQLQEAFQLPARDVADALAPIDGPKRVASDLDRVQTALSTIAAHVGGEMAVKFIEITAILVRNAAEQTNLDNQDRLAGQIDALTRSTDLTPTENTIEKPPQKARTIPVHQPPEPGPVPGSTSERIDHYRQDEETGELRRMIRASESGTATPEQMTDLLKKLLDTRTGRASSE